MAAETAKPKRTGKPTTLKPARSGRKGTPPKAHDTARRPTRGDRPGHYRCRRVSCSIPWSGIARQAPSLTPQARTRKEVLRCMMTEPSRAS